MELDATYYLSVQEAIGHRLSVFNTIFCMLDNETRIAYFNGLVLPHFDYGAIEWRD